MKGNTLKRWLDLSQLVTAVVAVLAVAVAGYQIRESNQSQKTATAMSLYQDYLDLCLQYPAMAKPEAYEQILQKDETFERYTWFVTRLLFSAEKILEITHEPKWEKSISTQLKYHMEYLSSDAFLEHDSLLHYHPELSEMVVRLMQDYNPASARRLMAQAEKFAPPPPGGSW